MHGLRPPKSTAEVYVVSERFLGRIRGAARVVVELRERKSDVVSAAFDCLTGSWRRSLQCVGSIYYHIRVASVGIRHLYAAVRRRRIPQFVEASTRGVRALDEAEPRNYLPSCFTAAVDCRFDVNTEFR